MRTKPLASRVYKGGRELLPKRRGLQMKWCCNQSYSNFILILDLILILTIITIIIIWSIMYLWGLWRKEAKWNEVNKTNLCGVGSQISKYLAPVRTYVSHFSLHCAFSTLLFSPAWASSPELTLTCKQPEQAHLQAAHPQATIEAILGNMAWVCQRLQHRGHFLTALAVPAHWGTCF